MVGMLMETYLRQQVEKGEYGVAIIQAQIALDIADYIEKHRQPDRKAGRWIRRPYDGIYCTACGKGWSFMLGAPGDVEENYRYCPHCGAVMMEGEADAEKEV